MVSVAATAISFVMDLLVILLMLGGTFLMLVTGLGLLRLPDVYCRMHAAGKAGTLAISMLIMAPAVAFATTEPFLTARALLAVVFQCLTTPGATYLLAHACYVRDYPLHDGTTMDELKAVMPAFPEDQYGRE